MPLYVSRCAFSRSLCRSTKMMWPGVFFLFFLWFPPPMTEYWVSEEAWVTEYWASEEAWPPRRSPRGPGSGQPMDKTIDPPTSSDHVEFARLAEFICMRRFSSFCLAAAESPIWAIWATTPNLPSRR